MPKLLLLPERLFKKGQPGKSLLNRDALAREDAVAIAIAIAILLVRLIRIKNLDGIHLERHLQHPGDGPTYLCLPEDETKNGRPVQFEPPTDFAQMAAQHLKTRSPQLCPPGTP